jgi:hypothetical protein
MSTDEGHGRHIPALDDIPEQLREYSQFVCWREVKRGGRLTKEPVNPRNGQLADVSDAKTWADIETALDRAVALDCDGIGFVFTRNDPFCCADLDHCLDLKTGELRPEAAEIVSLLDSYTETSPSGAGLHIILRATPETERQRTKGFELYAWDHYVTLTGQLVRGAKPRIYERQKELRSLCAHLFGADQDVVSRQPAPLTSGLTDEEVIAKAKAAANGEFFTALHEGRWKELGYESQSEADYAYMGQLRFWTGGIEEQMVRIFRTSGLVREKAKRDDYVVGMARKLIDAEGEVYSGTRAMDLPLAISADTAWPAPLAPAAFHGPLGAAVQIIAPHCEGDPAALLVNALVAFGSLVGPAPHMVVGRDRHPARLFMVTVGDTSKARKGLTWNFIKDLFTGIDSTFPDRISDGLSSGEGLIYAVRNSVTKTDKDGLEEIVDQGIDDKRLLVVEGEFASVLKVGKRAGNTLSPVIRSAWDSGDLNTMVKNAPTRATAAHISILGHITREELIRELDSTEMANGFANRFLFVAARRSRKLAFGGNLTDSDLAQVRSQLNEALVYVQKMGRMSWAAATKPIWEEHYDSRLSEGPPGLLGHLTARSEAQVLRMAIVFALADRSSQITPDHLHAALEVWRYVDDSTRYIFGMRTGDEIADRIRAALLARPEGMSRTEIRNLFSRHETEARIEAALDVLLRLGQAVKQAIGTGGRPREVWRATQATEATEGSG